MIIIEACDGCYTVRSKFSISKDATMKFVVDINGAEIDDDDVLALCGDSKLTLMVLVDNEEWISSQSATSVVCCNIASGGLTPKV